MGGALGDLEPLERMHPGEVGGELAGLVGLYAADEVPGEARILHCGNLPQRLVEVALAELGEAGRGGRGDHFRGLGLGDCEECDRVRTSAAGAGGLRDALAHFPDVQRQILRTH